MLTLLLLLTPWNPPPHPVQVPATHLEGEVVLELRDPQAFADGVAQHGLLALWRDQEMADLMAEFGPWLGDRLQWLEHTPEDSPIRFAVSLSEAGVPSLELALGHELGALFPEGLPFGSPEAVSLAMRVLDRREGGFRGEPVVLVSAHWGDEELPLVRQAAEELLQYGNRKALENGSGPFFSAVSYGPTEVWELREPDSEQAALFLAFDEGSLVLCSEREQLLATVADARPDLSEGLVQARQTSLPGTLVAFVDVQPLVRAALDENSLEDREVRNVLETLGIDSWEWAAMKVRPEDRGFHVAGRLAADGTRGILGAFRHSAPAAELLSGVPAGAQFAAGVAVEPANVYAEFRRIVEDVAPEGEEAVTRAESELESALGVQLGDVLQRVGDRATFSLRLQDGVPAPPEAFLEVALHADSGLALTESVRAKIAAGQWPMSEMSLQNGTAFRLELPCGSLAPALSFDEDRLRVASSPLALNRWLGEDSQPSGMQDVLASLSHGSFQEATGVVVVDVPALAVLGYELGSPFLVGFLSQMGERAPFSPASLPSSDVLRRNLPPVIRVFRIHDHGVDFESHGLF